MSNVFFTADLHLHHRNIIKHCNRPFETVEQMNDELIRRWNATVVDNKAHVYVLGDFAWTRDWDEYRCLLHMLKGRKHLIFGNHDKFSVSKALSLGFVEACDVKRLKIDGDQIWLSHYAHRMWPNKSHGAYHLYGHSHGTLPSEGRSVDVGVDLWDFAPVNWNDLLGYFNADTLKSAIRVLNMHKQADRRYGNALPH